MMRAVDRVNIFLGRVAAWLFVATGAMLAWEVSARYLFNAPTIWAAELSQLAMAAAVFFASGDMLRSRGHIAVEILRERLGARASRIASAVSSLVVAVFAAVVLFYGAEIAVRSFSAGSTSGTLLNLPKWWGEAALPAGFFFLLMQSMVEFIRAVAGKPRGDADK